MSPPTSPPAQAEPPTLALDPDRIPDTVSKLRRRIEERFPGSALAGLYGSLHGIGEHTKTRLDHVDRPNLWLRAGTWMMVTLVAVGVITAFRAVLVEIPQGFDSAFTALQVPEAGIQDVVFIGVGLAFLVIMILDADR